MGLFGKCLGSECSSRRTGERVDVFEWVSKKDNLRQESKFPKKTTKKNFQKRTTEDITVLSENRCSKILGNRSTESSGESSDYFDCLQFKFCTRGLPCHSNFVVNVWESRSLDKNHHRIESDNF